MFRIRIQDPRFFLINYLEAITLCPLVEEDFLREFRTWKLTFSIVTCLQFFNTQINGQFGNYMRFYVFYYIGVILQLITKIDFFIFIKIS